MREVDGEVGEGPDGVERGKVDGAETVVGDVERLQPVDVLEGLILQLLNLQNRARKQVLFQIRISLEFNVCYMTCYSVICQGGFINKSTCTI